MANDDKVPVFGYIPLVGGLFNLAGKIPVVGDLLKFSGNLIDVPLNAVRNVGVGALDSISHAFGWGTTGMKWGFLGGLIKGGVQAYQDTEAGKKVDVIGTVFTEAVQMAGVGGVTGAVAGGAVGAGRGVIETARGLGQDLGDIKDDLVTPPAAVPQVTAGAAPKRGPSIT
ncbi:MAG: hypothetical protein EAZ74_03750 [Alphaproteobacteria bacterium]|nr:MAG: hypothetical protein EAY76_07360 [Alphaproteobacteria bacterium]TAF14539.1 MAG: hypothetical protein EAZ74_03750 [Alphaproteobacteria bacterium]TAF40037.1 MAG: hypothetical protein EAZ66_03815 [Alphaproteobacteria bacterium]TAF74918.1 MAG: hypothetical protein EAZ52_08030 [Alphaproteobacteria bacterium]